MPIESYLTCLNSSKDIAIVMKITHKLFHNFTFLMLYKTQQSLNGIFVNQHHVIGILVINRDVMRFYYLRCKIGIIQ